MNNDTKIAIFTIVNKLEVYKEFVENISKQKNVNYQLIDIQNCHMEYDSARDAFNKNAVVDNVDYYFFVHPDIRFLDEYSLFDIVKTINEIGDFGVVGVAGARKNRHKREIVTTIIQGKNRNNVGKSINKPELVQTVDECFFVIKRDYFLNHRFSNLIGWHLYGVEYCLESLKSGQKNYAIPARIWHVSPGNSLDEKYMSQLETIVQIYKDEYDMICTTVKGWKTRGFMALLYRKYYWLKQRIKRLILAKE